MGFAQQPNPTRSLARAVEANAVLLQHGSRSPVQRRTVARVVFQACVLAIIAAAFFVRAPHVAGISMEPRIDSGETVLVEGIGTRFRPLRRGEIIAFHHDGSERETYIKRVIGIPSDRVAIVRGTVYVNGSAIAEPYVRYHDDHSYPMQVVPAGDYFVLGDNRANSDDSRHFGFVARDDVIGRALFGLWPPRRLGAL